MAPTGYGSPSLLRACCIAVACQGIESRGLRAAWLRLRAGSLSLWWYRARLPRVEVRLTDSPSGRMIGEHLAIRRGRHWRFRHAQGVLPLPAEISEYLRGRHRQAVRTNLRHAREAGLRVEHHPLSDWRPGSDDSRLAHISPGAVERWDLVRSDGAIVGQAILSVDEEVALLHGLMSLVPYGRWLLHTAIVERLCGSCGVLLINCEDAYLMSAGTQYFQRLLGYRIAGLRLGRAPGGASVSPPRRRPAHRRAGGRDQLAGADPVAAQQGS